MQTSLSELRQESAGVRGEVQGLVQAARLDQNASDRLLDEIQQLKPALLTSTGQLQRSVDQSGRVMSQMVAGPVNQIQLLTTQAQLIQTVHDRVREGNPWEDRGEIGDMANCTMLLAKFPLTKYQWGIAYNTYGPEPVTVCKWNLGILWNWSRFAMGMTLVKCTRERQCSHVRQRIRKAGQDSITVT